MSGGSVERPEVQRAKEAIAADAYSPVGDATLTLLAKVGRDVLEDAKK